LKTFTGGSSTRPALSAVLALVLALAISPNRAESQNATGDDDGGGPFPVGSAVHVNSASTYVPADAAAAEFQSASTARREGPVAVTSTGSGGLVINPTFDSSITGNVQSAQIQAAVQTAIGVYESLFKDPVTVSILFRYAPTHADGTTPLPPQALALTLSVIYTVPWTAYTNALTADAKTTNDATANANLPASALSTNIALGSANGRAVGLPTPPALLANGQLGMGAPYDAIVTLNSGLQFLFTRPPAPSDFDALRVIEHEMDEALGLGSFLNTAGSDLRPQDLFSWSAAGVRNRMSSGVRYFSIDGGATDIVGFNQNPSGDFGDWLSGTCPAANPSVQDAFSCPDQMADLAETSPEGVNLDVIGYDLGAAAAPTPTVEPSDTPTRTEIPTATATPAPSSTATIAPTLTATSVASSTPTTIQTGTQVPTSTSGAATSTATAIPSPTLTAATTCVGDCGGAGSVSIGNLITLVNIALGSAQPTACPQGIPSGAQVTISLLIQAVNNALNGCTSAG
jgi:hypothetical protein